MTKDISLLQANAIELLKKLIATPSFSKEEQNTADLLEQFLIAHGVKPFAYLNNIWAKNKYFDEALNHLEDIAVLSKRKEPLKKLALFLVQRDF